MDIEHAAELIRDAGLAALVVAAPALVVVALVGFGSGLLQGLTQIQDPTLTLIPKLVAATLVVLLLLPWMLGRLVDYSATLIRDIPSLF
jgi:flagellar biosynthetic protein FliQ